MFNKEIRIGTKKIGLRYPTYFIADIAANHDGDLNRAKELIKEFESTKVTNEAQKESEIVDTLKSIDPNSLTPLVAFDTLVRLIELAKYIIERKS